MSLVVPSHTATDVSLDRSVNPLDHVIGLWGVLLIVVVSHSFRVVDGFLPTTQWRAPSTTLDGLGPNAASGIHSLPAEIFLDIVFQSIDLEDHSDNTLFSRVLPLIHVCVYWWHSIRSDPRFWRNISFEEESMADTVLKRNPNGPLVVICRTWSAACDCTRFLQVVKEHAHRWQSAIFRFERGRHMEELHGVYAPLFTRLEIENEIWGNDDDVFLPITLPRLEHLDISNTRMTWGELSGLKYLRLTNIPEIQLSLDQLITILSSSPELEWLGLENITDAAEDPEKDTSTPAPLTLRALRGFESVSGPEYDQAAHYLHCYLVAPNCYRFAANISFEDVIRSGPNIKKLVELPMTAAGLGIAVDYWRGGSKISVGSGKEMRYRIAGWVLDPRSTPELSLIITNVPLDQGRWSFVVDTLGIPVEKLGVTLRLSRGDRPGFSMDDMAFWNETSHIEFIAGYPHILTVMRNLSEPHFQDGVPTWPCPRLKSIRLLYGSYPHEQEWCVRGITQVVIQDTIRKFLKGRLMEFDAGQGDGELAVPVECRSQQILVTSESSAETSQKEYDWMSGD